MELDEYDRENELTATTCALSEAEIKPRRELLAKIESAFNAYGIQSLSCQDGPTCWYRKAAVLTSSHELAAFHKPTAPEDRSVRTFLKNNNPIHDMEMSYIKHKDDLVTLRPGREHAVSRHRRRTSTLRLS